MAQQQVDVRSGGLVTLSAWLGFVGVVLAASYAFYVLSSDDCTTVTTVMDDGGRRTIQTCS